MHGILNIALAGLGLGRQMELMGVFWKAALAVLVALILLKLFLAGRAGKATPEQESAAQALADDDASENKDATGEKSNDDNTVEEDRNDGR